MEETPRVRMGRRLDNGGRLEIDQYRRELLDRVFRPFVLLGLVALGFGAWIALRDGQWGFAVAYLALYATSCFFAISVKRLSVGARSAVLVLGLYAVAIAALLRLGINGVGFLVLVAACGLTAMLRGTRDSLWAVVLAVLGIGLAAAVIVHGHIALTPERLHASLSVHSWVVVGITFVGVTIGLILPFHVLSMKAADSFAAVGTQARELERSNQRLQGEIERRQRAETALRASELRYRGIFEATPVGIWEQDLSEVRAALRELRKAGVQDMRAHLHSHPEVVERLAALVHVRDVNEAAVSTYGAKSKQELMSSLPRVVVPESLESFREVLVTLAEGGRELETESISQTLQGERIHVLVRAAIPEDEEASVLLSTLDVSDRKALERSLAQAQKMEAIGTLAGGIAHDFNNLLMGVRGTVALLLRGGGRQQMLREHLENIDHLVDSGASLTGQLLGFARGGKYDVHTTDLTGLLDRTLSIFARARKEIRTLRSWRTDLWTVDVDRGQIEQVLLNLFVNAGHAMSSGGLLTVEADNVTIDQREADNRRIPPGDYVCIVVRDTGAGMDEQTCARVFEPFFTTRQLGRGTGLGLASAYGIVRNHGGQLSVDSKVGEGTAFFLHLPASKKSVPDVDEPATSVVDGAGLILLVDDEASVLQVTQLLLEEVGYRVLSAHDGAEALRLFEQHRQEIALVVLDMVMPGMSGTDVFEKVRAVDGVPVLLSSGYAQDAKADELLRRGANGFIQKPFGLEELSQKLHEIIEADRRS